MNYPRIAIDLGGLDRLWPGAGLYRYAIDLVCSLAELRSTAQFLVLGATPEPVDDLAGVFQSDTGWEYHHFPRSGGFASAYLDHLRLAFLLKSLRADLCHCLHSFAPVVAPCSVIGTVHDLMFELFPEYADAVRSRPYRIYRWSVRRRLQRIICISQSTANDLQRLWGVSTNRIDVVPSGLRVFRENNEISFPENHILRRLPPGPLLSSPFNLEPRKNLHTLLAAFAKVRQKFPQIPLVLYGRGGWTEEREESYRQQIENLGLGKQVIETGVLSDTDLWYLYKKTSIFVFPSLYEGFGYPVVEAMAAGACPVVRGVSAMAETVGMAGLQVEPFTANTLADAIFNLLIQDPKRRMLGEMAAERARQFTSQKMAQGTFETYSRVLKRKALS